MKRVKDMLERKNGEIWSVSPRDTVHDALKLMSEKRIGAALVIDENKLVGIFSERDYARKVVLKERSSKETPVKDVMSDAVLYVRPEHSVEDCMALMTEKRLRHLPVLDDDRLVGVISVGDVIKTVVSKQDLKIKQLENYITSQDQFYRY